MQHAQLPLYVRAVVALRACSAKSASRLLSAPPRDIRPSSMSELRGVSSSFRNAEQQNEGSSDRSTATGSTASDSSKAPALQGQHVLECLKAPSKLVAGIYIVATPIGNLEDITLRALRVLRDADFILAEDTRHTRKLLTFFGLTSQLYSFHEHNERLKESQVLERVRGGAAVALVSDAGVPAVSDPGASLVAAAVRGGLSVTPVPGPSAVLAALVASGLACDAFQFVGFLPAKQGQRLKQLQQLAGSQATQILFIPPHGLAAVLADMVTAFGAGRRCVIARELTKVHEQFHRGPLNELAAEAEALPFKGELTVVVEGAGASDAAPALDDTALQEQLQELMQEGVRPSQAAKIVSKRLNVPKRQVYDLAVHLAGSQLRDSEN